MFIPVRMLAHHNEKDPKWRIVQFSDHTPTEKVLETTFYYGQNDFQPVENCCSVSVADVVFLPKSATAAIVGRQAIQRSGDIEREVMKEGFTLHVVASFGFKELTWEQFEELENMDRRDRSFSDLVK